ncbi:MAG: CoA transferase [Acidisphaera sp.]|nr:CoA transferase [Acidisphaera sp.]MBV9812023.1 CoA transferase [Acetobacteraceae bacterium]
MEQAVAAPYCTSRLADAGARVIKIERPGDGDFARGYDRAAKGLSSYFVWLNRGKESVALDIKDANDRTLLNGLVAAADVWVQNLAPGAAGRAGFGSAALRERHDRLITVDISGYGEGGEASSLKAYDLLVQAESGLCSLTGLPEGPGRVGVSVCDIACGMNAHSAVLEALIERAASGRGKGIAVSLFDGMADWMNVPLLYFEGTGRAPERVGLAHPSICPYGAFATADGALVLISIQNEREWASFCRHFLEEPDLPTREAFRSNVERVAHRGMVDAHVAAAFGRLSREVCVARLCAGATAYGFVNDVQAFARHPALRRVALDTPGGTVHAAAPAPLFSDGERALGRVPTLGEHTVSVRAEFGS